MIIVRLRVTKDYTGEYWKDRAKGAIDDYGNPFRIITLLWNYTQMNRMADYGKTRGFQDAIISKNGKTGGFKIRFRDEGCVMWQRPPGGVGDFTGEAALTPWNLKKLASAYYDRKWRIQDADIDQLVKAMADEKLSKMDEASKEFNKTRVEAMNKSKYDKNIVTVDGLPLQAKREELEKESLAIAQKKQELAKKEAELGIIEAEKIAEGVEAIKNGEDVVKYSNAALNKMNLQKLKTTAKILGVKFPNTVTTNVLRQACKDAQVGKEPVFEIIPKPLTKKVVVQKVVQEPVIENDDTLSISDPDDSEEGLDA